MLSIGSTGNGARHDRAVAQVSCTRGTTVVTLYSTVLYLMEWERQVRSAENPAPVAAMNHEAGEHPAGWRRQGRIDLLIRPAYTIV